MVTIGQHAERPASLDQLGTAPMALSWAERPLRIVDFNNFFSPSGGGIRTYHLNKLKYFSDYPGVSYSLIIPSWADFVEPVGQARLIHLKAPSIPKTNNYRFFCNPFKLAEVIEEIQPDLVEVGGAYVDPFLIRYAMRHHEGVVAGYWHADYPTAYFETLGNRLSPAVGKLFEQVGWHFARRTYGRYDATFAASDCVADRLRAEGIDRVLQCPLGVDIDQFNPSHRDPEVRRKLQAEDRPLVFFPHRFCREKGIKEVFEALPEIARRTGAVFAFCGGGPALDLVKELAETRNDCHYLGYIKSPKEMARYYASSDLVYGLSEWETFGLSIVEAMSSGVPLIGADRGAAQEWITRSRCGITIPHGQTQALVEASVKMLGRSDLELVGRRGRQFVTKYFSWEATFERMLTYYRALIRAQWEGQSAAEVSRSLPTLWEMSASSAPQA
jgi:alpha-1,6-mannosyltransferase